MDEIREKKVTQIKAVNCKNPEMPHDSLSCTFAVVMKTRKPTNWWLSAKHDDTHPRATVVYNACYHLFRKHLYTPMHLFVCVN